MGYAKVLEGALSLFPKRIKVTFVDHLTGAVIEKTKLDASRLPATFLKPTFIEYGGSRWRIMKATPANDDYLIFKKLTLEIVPADWNGVGNLAYLVATRCESVPEVIGSPITDKVNAPDSSADASGGFAAAAGEDGDGRPLSPSSVSFSSPNLLALPASSLPFDNVQSLQLEPHEWMQTQFIGQVSLEQAQIILRPLDEKRRERRTDPLLGYEECYVRPSWCIQPLQLSLQELIQHFNVERIGNVHSVSGYYAESFSFDAGDYYIYGVLDGVLVVRLGVYGCEHIDELLLTFIGKHQLAIVNWIDGEIFSGDAEKVQEDDETLYP